MRPVIDELIPQSSVSTHPVLNALELLICGPCEPIQQYEDFMNIFGASDVDQAYIQVAKAGCKHLVYTKGSNGIDVRSYRHSCHYSVPPIRVISTIGAGDAFNAGLICALKDYKCDWSDTLTWEWHEIILTGILFSANVCQSLDNYISVDFGNSLKKYKLA